MHPEILRTQLRAILRAGASGDLRLMFPMIARTEEVDRLLAIRDAIHHELEKEHLPHRWPIPTGIMIETPAAALLTDAFAERVDFFSVGTNDLTQYTLAAERGHAQLVDYADPLHPALLRLIRQVVEGAHRHGKPVTVCGEMAAEPEAAIPLVGLGVDEMSVVSARIAEVKSIVQRLSFGDAVGLAEKMLGLNEAGDVRRLAAEYLKTLHGVDGDREDSLAAG
jgi:phosphoenolpyruvate-protein kinase (PTS system EI component)